MCSALRQLLHVVDHDVGHQRDIVFRRDEDVHLHPTFGTAFQGLHHRGGGGEVRIHDFHRVLGVVEGLDIETAHDLVGDMRFAVGDANGLVASRHCLEILRVGEFLLGHPFPHPDEDGLQLVDGRSFDAAVHVTPFTYLFGTDDIVVGDIHAPCIADASVDDNNLPVVTGPDMVHPGEADGVELIDLDAVGMQTLEVFLLQRLVVGVVAEAIEEASHLHPLAAFLTQQVVEQVGDGVVAEVEILHVDAALGLSDDFEHIGKLLPARHEQANAVVAGEGDALLTHRRDDERVAVLCMSISRYQQE